jgi:hypothetical protein
VAGDEKARARMRRYNIGDVGQTSLEGVIDRLRPWISGINFGLYGVDDGRVCVNCGGSSLSSAGSSVTAVTRYPAYRCDSCGSIMRGKHRSAAVPMRGVVR